VLVARDEERAAPFAAMLRAVVEARRHRYLMLNAPESALPSICALVAPRAPSVLPLAEDGMVAVHVLVPAADVWRLLPQLEAVGGSSILVVPVERMAA
jgi:ATP phosphoribosyltransferase